MNVVGVIPCRYGASRFPGKALADIHGKPMMWHVYNQASKAGLLDRVVIASDDDRIIRVCEDLNLPAVMTRRDHLTGTDRLVECIEKIPADIYVNVQGDEPMIDPRAIDAVAGAIMKIEDPDVMASNGYKPLHDPSEVINTNTVKVTMTKSGMALSYSRLPIPYPKDGSPQHFRQLGLYAFRREGLATFGACRAGPVETAEGVEMLRFLEHGYRVAMVLTPDDNAISVDTPADLERARELMAGLNQ